VRYVFTLGLILASTTAAAWAQSEDGARVFAANCASCHTGAPESRAPAIDALRARTPQDIMETLLTGAKRRPVCRWSNFLLRRLLGEDQADA